MTTSAQDFPPVVFDGSRLSLQDIVALSTRRARAVVDRVFWE